MFLLSRISSPSHSLEIVGGSRLCLFPRLRERDSIWLMNTKRDTRPAIDYSLIAPKLVGSNLSAFRTVIFPVLQLRQIIRLVKSYARVYPLCDFVTRRTCETCRVCVRRSVKMAILRRIDARCECNKDISPARYLIAR